MTRDEALPALDFGREWFRMASLRLEEARPDPAAVEQAAGVAALAMMFTAMR